MKTKQPSKLKSIILLPLATILALAGWASNYAQAEAPASEKTPMEGRKMGCCKAMTDKKQEVITNTETQNVKLARMTAEMKAASGDQKIEIMAGILEEIVEQQVALEPRMEEMEGKPMKMGNAPMAGCCKMDGGAKVEGAKAE